MTISFKTHLMIFCVFTQVFHMDGWNMQTQKGTWRLNLSPSGREATQLRRPFILVD